MLLEKLMDNIDKLFQDIKFVQQLSLMLYRLLIKYEMKDLNII